MKENIHKVTNLKINERKGTNFLLILSSYLFLNNLNNIYTIM